MLFAMYSALSARSTSSSALEASPGRLATPMLTVRGLPLPASSRPMPAFSTAPRTFSASFSAASFGVFGSRIANSSPP